MKPYLPIVHFSYYRPISTDFHSPKNMFFVLNYMKMCYSDSTFSTVQNYLLNPEVYVPLG